jgi:SAM-dependent methyltransferase
MIEATLTWIKYVNNAYQLSPNKILDIGSKDRNKKVGARELFSNSEYIGTDIEDGPNVDLVLDAYCLSDYFDANSFDAILCLHLFEHLAKPWLVMDQVDYLLKENGFLYVSMPTIDFPIHNYPGDYWRITEQGMKEGLMSKYKILSLGHAVSTYGKHPFINCLGVSNGSTNS